MKFEMSNNIAIPTNNPEKAIEFYSNILGFTNRSNTDDYGDFNTGACNMFVQKDDLTPGVVMEFFVEDLKAAKEYLIANGCTIIRWEGLGKDCYVQDPFGLRFNVWQK